MYLETDESSWFLSNRTVQFWKRDTPTAAMLHVISRLKRWIEFTIMDAVFGLFFFACSSYQVFLQMCVKLKYARSHFIFSYNFHHFIAASGSVPELVYLSSTVVINKMNCREVFFFFLLLSSFVYYSVEIFMFLHTVCVWQQLLISALVNGAKVCQTGL